MNIIFIHTDFPGQFRLLAEISGKDKNNKIIFITSENTDRHIPGVQKIVYSEKSSGENKEGPSKQPPGLSVVNVLVELKKKNFVPDLIVGHSGPGTSFYVKDVFPDTPFLCFFQWFHTPDMIRNEFNSAAEGPELKIRMNLRNRNLSILADLCACDYGICPTDWQKSRFPTEFQSKLSVVHEGIDTNAFQPSEDRKFKTAHLDLSSVKQLVTYTANVLAPYAGFQQFMEALPTVLEQKPDARVVIAGADRVSFADASGNKKSYKSLILEKVKLDTERVHFIEGLTFNDYKQLLQASSVHVYLDSPLMVSRSLLEAMSCECLVIAPDIQPVKEVIKDGNNGIIADFSTPEKIAEKLVACLDYPSFMIEVKRKARQTIVDQYSLEKILPRLLNLVQKMAMENHPSTLFG
ncbi:MAG: glycosyltransferase [Desulfobacula sp.]|nr:glycosyltransferase [Desulfobacula sp.]